MKRPGAGLGYWVFFAALVLRLLWVMVAALGAGGGLYPDEQLHWELGRNLVGDGALVSDDGRYAARMPLYPTFLALFAWLGSGGMILARLAQAVIGAATAWLVYRFARRAMGPLAALLAGALVVLDLYAIFFANLLLTEVVFTFAGVALTYETWRILRQPKANHMRAVGLVALLGAAAILTRPSAAGWVGLIWVLLALRGGRQRVGLRRAGICVALFVVAILPWGIRNRVLIGDWAWLSANSGLTLYDAMHPEATGASDQSFLQEMPELAGMNEAERDAYLKAAALEEMREQPGRVLRLAGVKFLRTWSLRPNVEQYSGGLTAVASVAYMLPVLVLMLVGTWRLLAPAVKREQRQRRLLALLLWLPIVYFTVVHSVYIGSVRYRVPVMPFVQLLAGAALLSSTVSAPHEIGRPRR